MSFNKTYSTYDCPNKDIIVRVSYAPHCTAKFRYVYNNISESYMGLEVCGFIEDFRGLIRVVPEFFDLLSDHSFERDLELMGFTHVEMAAKDRNFYDLIERA